MTRQLAYSIPAADRLPLLQPRRRAPPLIEIVQGVNTSSTTVEKAFALARALGKTPVLVQDRPGFVVNRLLTRLFSEVLQLIDDGSDPFTVDHALDPVGGLPMTPLRLLQFIGPRVQLHICESLHDAYPERFPPSAAAFRGWHRRGLPGYLADDGSIVPERPASCPRQSPLRQTTYAPESCQQWQMKRRICSARAWSRGGRNKSTSA